MSSRVFSRAWPSITFGKSYPAREARQEHAASHSLEELALKAADVDDEKKQG